MRDMKPSEMEKGQRRGKGVFTPPGARENLGFSKVWEMVSPRSAMGRRVKVRTRPFMPGMEAELEAEFDCLEMILSLWDTYPDSFFEITGILENAKDPFSAISLLRENRTLPPQEMFLIAHLCFTVNRLRQAMMVEQGGEGGQGIKWPQKVVPPQLKDLESHVLPGSKGQPTFYVSDAYSEDLAAVRKERREKEKALREEMSEEAEKVEKVLGKRPGLKEEIALRNTEYELVEKARLMPELAETRETLTHVHFRLKPTQDAIRLEREISKLKRKERQLEEQVLQDLSLKVRQYLPEIQEAVRAIGDLDFLIAKGEVARSMGAVRPQIVGPCFSENGQGGRPQLPLVLEDAFHPEVKEEVEARGGTYQPISIEIDSTVSVITGPNMGGKTVALQTIGLCVAMVQWGLMAPCKGITMGLYDFIHFQSQEEEVPGLSSFAAEMVNLKEPLSRMDERGLILLDEIGRGTNPAQGLALYAAILQYYLENDVTCSHLIATTHYHGLADMLGVPHWQVKGVRPDSEKMKEAQINGENGLDWLYRHMDYALQKVGPDTPTPHDALLIARVLGINREIIEKAEGFLRGDEPDGEVKL